MNDSLTGANDKATTRFKNRPPGNLPRLMGLDESGNKNLMDCVNRHISATKRLSRGPDVATDPKSEFCDTVRASRALLRCWDSEHGTSGGAPSSETIITGNKRVWGRHLGEIRMAKGCMVGARSGHRRRAAEPMARGGKREAGPAPWEGGSQWLHADAHLAQGLNFERCAAQGA